MKQLTIAIPAYNAAEYLDNCLGSFVYADGSLDDRLEIIVINDGSKDETLSKAREWEARYPDVISVIDKENGGHGSGINAGIDAASGRFFKVIDSDDWIVTESLGNILDELTECYSDAVITGYHTVNTASDVILPYGTGQQLPPDSETVQKLGEEYAALRCFGSRMATMEELMEEVDNIPAVQSFHGIMYRTDFYRDCNIRMTEKVFFEDQEYAILPFAYVENVLLMPYFFYEYRIGSADQSVNFENQAKRSPHFLTVTRKMIDFHLQVQPLEEAQDEFIKWRLCNAVVSYYATVLIKSSDKEGGPEKALAFHSYLCDVEPDVAERCERKLHTMLKLSSNSLVSKVYGKLFNSSLYDKFKKRWIR